MNPKEEIAKQLQKSTGQNHVRLTSSGNMAIFVALATAKSIGKKTVLIPADGGWISYKTYPEMLGMKIKEIKTELGLLDHADLSKKANSQSCLLYNSLAAYVIEQNVFEIEKICVKNECLTINDCTGLIGTDLCIGNMLVASFGEGKIVNSGYGGMISFSSKESFELAKTALSLDALHDSELPQILKAINDIDTRRDFLTKIRDSIRTDLSEFRIIHKESNHAINVIILYRTDAELKKITDYCESHNYQFVLCPKYIKLDVQGVSIEVKKIKMPVTK